MAVTNVIVVGPTRGFGRALLLAAVKSKAICLEDTRTHFILLTSDEARATQVWDSVYQEATGEAYKSNSCKEASVEFVKADLTLLGDCKQACEFFETAWRNTCNECRRWFVFMNAGSVTPVGLQLSSSTNSAKYALDIQDHVTLNFTSFVLILRSIMQTMLSSSKHMGAVPLVRCVNVSSLAAIEPLYGMSIYCSLKAAREMYIRSLQEELANHISNVDAKFLNYAPGPMRTDLTEHDLLCSSEPNALKNAIELQYVDTNISATKCVQLITDGTDFAWSSGDHIDFYDVFNP